MRQDVPDVVTQFLKELSRREVSDKTLSGYGSDLALFARFLKQTTGEAFSPTAVTPTDIREYRGHLLNIEARTPATINRRLAALRTFFLWAKAKGLATDSPTESVKGVSSTPQAPHWLEKREVDKLIRQVERGRNKRDLAIILTLRHTGIRVSELSALRLSDVEISERKGQLVVRSGKGRKFRLVPLNVEASRAIADYLQVRPTVPTDLLFVGQRGDGLKSRAVELLVAKYSQAAGLEATPHTLRHSFGKHMLDEGVDLGTVSTLMGHERLQTTLLYTTPGKCDLEQAVERLSHEPQEVVR